MSTGRWRVTGLHGAHEFFDWETGESRTEVCTRWGVTSPEGYGSEFSTHVEALAYADRQARTVTLVLPPVNPDQSIQGDYEGSFPLRVRRNWYGETALSIPGECMFAITPEEREKLALYLLAEHYHHERNQK